MQVLRLAEILLAEDFLLEGAWEWVPETWKYMKFVQFWSSPRVSRLYGQINSCLENFVFFTEMVIIWLSPRVSWLFGRINSFLENFVFFAEKWSLLALGVAMDIWRQIKLWQDKICTIRGYRLGCFLR